MQMEQTPLQPELQANVLANRIEALLGLPDRVHSFQEHNTYLDGGYALTVRAVSDSGETDAEAFDPNSRYVYIRDTDGQHLLFSIDFDTFMQGDAEQITDDIAFPDFFVDLENIISRAESDSDGLSMIRQIQAAVRTAYEHHELTSYTKERLQATFLHLLNKGSTVTTRMMSHTHADGTLLEIEQRSIEGPLEHVWPHDLENPALKVAVLEKDSRHQIVLQRMRDGIVETLRELEDEIELAASYANEENIERDEEGNTVAVSALQDEIAVVHAAERAMGLRGINPSYLDIIGRYVDELLVP